MPSIKSSLIKQVTLIITFSLFCLLLLLNISMTTYLEKQFEDSLIQEGKTLATLITVEGDNISLNSYTKLIEAFNKQSPKKYLQMWSGNKIVDKPELFFNPPHSKVSKIKLIRDKYTIKSIDLADGRSARIFIYNLGGDEKLSTDHGSEVYFGLTSVSDNLENIIILIDIIFILSAVITISLICYQMNRIICQGLKPLNLLSQQIRAIDFINDNSCIKAVMPTKETTRIIDEFNHFLLVNRALLQSEQRLIADIAHELKTPISELISITEIAIKFPHNGEVLTTFKDDVVSISMQMKNIVNSLLMFNKANSKHFTTTELDLVTKVNCFIERSHSIQTNGQSRFDTQCPSSLIINSNAFCIEAIITNLINNALYYSPKTSIVDIVIHRNENQTTLSISNELSVKMSENDLLNMFQPLWQKEAANTFEDHFGLGLSIVKRLSHQMGIQISVQLQSERMIEFKLIFP